MSHFLYISGFIIGVAIFLYFLSFYNSGREKIKKITKKNNEKKQGKVTPPSSVEPKNIEFANLTAHPGSRLCPFCRTTLTKYETLYASHVETESGRKILIHGCRYCYKPDEGSDVEGSG